MQQLIDDKFQLELLLLELIQKGKGKWSWYDLANALSRRNVPREPDMMYILKDLEDKGLILRKIVHNSPFDSYSITFNYTFDHFKLH